MRYEITGEINEGMLEIVRAIEVDKDPIIFLDIHSGGGCCATGLAFLGVLQQARRKKQKIVTRNRGIAFSQAASLLYQGFPLYLTDVAVTMSHRAQIIDWFPSSIEEIYSSIKSFFENRGKRDFLSILNQEIATFEPIDLIIDYYKDKEFKGDYFMLPSDLKAILGKQVKIRDIPEEIASLVTWEPKNELASLMMGGDMDDTDDVVVEDDEGFEYLKELEPDRLIKLLDALVEEKNRRELENAGG
jgi:hypothetical protein